VTPDEPGGENLSTPVRRQTLDERYGVESPTRRRVRQVAAAAFVLALLGWVGWAAWSHSQGDVTGRLKAFEVVSEHEVDVAVVVSRPAGQAVVCDLIAQADDHSTVGEGQVRVPAGDARDLTTTATIRTDRMATSVTVSNCRSS
jgi:hypothetical protein